MDCERLARITPPEGHRQLNTPEWNAPVSRPCQTLAGLGCMEGEQLLHLLQSEP